jgi:tRNA(fMet)-specific endonuclease VapC
MLDTNMISFLVRGNASVLEALKAHRQDFLCISALTLAEIKFGLARKGNPARLSDAMDKVLSPIEVLPFDADCAVSYGDIRSFLEKGGSPIGAMDMLIAAHAAQTDCILVTDNTKAFARVPHLMIENWLQR